MASKKILTDDLRYLLFSEIYLRYSEPKTKRRAFSILEAAITCFDRKGFENVTLETIARQAGVTRPLLRHYFSGLDEIHELSLKYVRVTGQRIVLDTIGSAERPDEIFKKYLEGHYRWFTHFESQIRVWLSFLSLSSRRKKERELNAAAQLAGRKRLIQLISDGRKAGVFKHQDDNAAARLIQTLILGWVFLMATEDMVDREQYSKDVISECFKALEASVPEDVTTRKSR